MDVRSMSTSELIAMMSVEDLTAALESEGIFGAGSQHERRTILLTALAEVSAEIDRRIPIPKEQPADDAADEPDAPTHKE